jgi:hypothetical protein
MNKQEQILSLYKKFCFAQGNQHIASEYAIKKLNFLVKNFQIKSILEIGLGIGSISGILLALNRNKSELAYSGTEANDFCLKALPKNLKEDFNRLEIYSDITEIPVNKNFDLIIIDGKDQNLKFLKDLISQNGILAIEGDRIQQQDSLQELFPNHKYVHCISNEKNKTYSPFPTAQWQGGLKFIFINPTGFQKLWWIKEKISTKLKYRLFR